MTAAYVPTPPSPGTKRPTKPGDAAPVFFLRLRRLACALTGHKPSGPVYADVLNLGIKARQCERCGRMVTL